MNCQRVRDDIKAYIDGELSVLARWQVARHLESCDACRQEEIAMTKLTEKLSDTEQTPAPEGLRDRVMSELEFEKPVQKARSWTTHPAVQFLTVGAIVAILAAIVAPTFYSAKQRSSVVARQAVLRHPQYGGIPVRPMSPPAMPAEAPARENAGESYPTPRDEQPAASQMPLMIIKTAEIQIEVKRFRQVYDEAVVIAGSVGGYVTDSSAEKMGDGQYGTVTMRVPANSFDRVLDRLGRLGKIESKKITGEDVTGEVVDLEARLRNKRAEERQYLEIMNRAKRIPDIMAVSNELYRVRGEIEEAQGRLKYLRSAVSMSTINVALNEKGTRRPDEGPSLLNTLSNAANSLVDTARTLARIAIWLIVYSPFWAIPIGIWVVIRRRSAAR